MILVLGRGDRCVLERTVGSSSYTLFQGSRPALWVGWAMVAEPSCSLVFLGPSYFIFSVGDQLLL